MITSAETVEESPLRPRFPLAGRPHAKPASQRAASQKRKYRCAIGSTFAGSHQSNWPSARTW